MRIAVCASQSPFRARGHSDLACALVARLREWAHEAEVIRLPRCSSQPDELLRSYLAWRLVNVKKSDGVTIDRVIALGYPAFSAAHPHKVTWLTKQYRQAYSQDRERGALSGGNERFLDLVRRMDKAMIGESRAVFSISQYLASRLQEITGIQSKILYPPPVQEGSYYNDGYGDYVLYAGPLYAHDRVDLLVRAMGHVQTPVQCRLAGKGGQLGPLKELATSVAAQERISFLKDVSPGDLLGQYAGALAVYCAPLGESYVSAALSAFSSGKPVLTTSDSNGVLEFVIDRQKGLVSSPGDPRALAQSIDELYLDRELAERMGTTGQERVAGITWEATIAALLEG